MEIANPRYSIQLPKGKAKRPFFELSEEEQYELGVAVFERVKAHAAEFGLRPVTTQSIARKHRRIKRSV